MDGGLVSDNTAGEQIPRLAYTTQFYEAFPYYLAIGMTHEQYWEQDCELVKYYRKAAKIRLALDNQQAWLNGLYVYEAVGDLIPLLQFGAKKPKSRPYPSKPFEFDAKKVQKSQEEKKMSKGKAFMEAFMVANNKRFEQKGVQNVR